MTPAHQVAWLALCLLALPGSLRGQDLFDDPAGGGKGKEFKVLFLGNSYTYCNHLPRMVQIIAKAQGRRLKTDMHATGGASFGSHWQGKKALAKLAGGEWNAVVLQDQSMMPVMAPAQTIRQGGLWVEQVKKKGARPILFMTWARQGQPKMQEKLTETYCRLAHAGGAEVAPVGLAWARVLREKPKLVLHTKDRSHPSQLGSYLAACVMFATICNASPEGAPGELTAMISPTRRLVFCRVPVATARYLQKTAWAVVSEFRKNKTIEKMAKKAAAPAKRPSPRQ